MNITPLSKRKKKRQKIPFNAYLPPPFRQIPHKKIAIIGKSGNGKSKASCKVSNWPGERFVILFASYNADGSLCELTYVKDYDGSANTDKVYETSDITVPEGGKTKIMVWNGFGEISPMTVSVGE